MINVNALSDIYISILFENGSMNILEISNEDFNLSSIKGDSNILSIATFSNLLSVETPQIVNFHHIKNNISQWEELCLSRRDVLPEYVVKLSNIINRKWRNH